MILSESGLKALIILKYSLLLPYFTVNTFNKTRVEC